MKKAVLLGLGAAGNKAAIDAIENKVLPKEKVWLVNTTMRDIPEKYHDRAIIFGENLSGCGKERKLAKDAILEKLRDDSDNTFETIVEEDDDLAVLVANAEGGTGSGSIAIIAKYLKEVIGINTHIMAFTGFETDVRGLKNTVDFFQDMDEEYIIQTISNKKFLNECGGNIRKAEKAANIEFCKRLTIMIGTPLIDSDQNIDDTDLHKLINTPGFMDIEYKEFDKIKNMTEFESLCSDMMDSSKSLDFEPTAVRIGVILNISDKNKDHINYTYNKLEERLGHPFELYQHVQYAENYPEFIAIIASGIKMPLDDIIDTYEEYKKSSEKVSKSKDNFFAAVAELKANEEDDAFDLKRKSISKQNETKKKSFFDQFDK